MLNDIIQQLMHRQNLTAKQSKQVIEAMLQSDNEIQAAAVMALLHAKGETAEEVYGITDALAAHMQRIQCNKPLIDIVGTGGDGANSVNISTASSILVASCGVTVAKHGNRSVSSRCGSADFLESLGIKIDMPPKQVQRSIEQLNFGFCFAPTFHPAFKQIAKLRKALAVPTVFNLLGPLLNPASADYYLIGVYTPELMPLFAEVLLRKQIKHAMVVYGNGLDEISCLGKSSVIEIKNDQLLNTTIDPKDYGFSYCQLSELQGGDAQTNQKILLAALSGKPSAVLDTLLLNAGAAMYVADHCESIAIGIELAKQAIEYNKPLQLIESLVAFSCCEVTHA